MTNKHQDPHGENLIEGEQLSSTITREINRRKIRHLVQLIDHDEDDMDCRTIHEDTVAEIALKLAYVRELTESEITNPKYR